MENDYEKMWNILKRNISTDIKMLSSGNTDLNYSDILRMSTAKIVQQSMDLIEKEVDPHNINS